MTDSNTTEETAADTTPLAPTTISVAIIEPNSQPRRRLARAARAVVEMGDVVSFERMDKDAICALNPTLVACPATEVAELLPALGECLPFTHLLAWTSRDSRTLLHFAGQEPRFSNVVGWPGFASSPRPWELALAARQVSDPRVRVPDLSELLRWGATMRRFTPTTDKQLAEVVAEVRAMGTVAADSERVGEQLGVAAHELLMNAMYAAPADSAGHHPFAADRRASIDLDPRWAPTLLAGTDGASLGVQVTDPFGTLERHQVFTCLVRGLQASAATDAERVVDTSGGGAGLGIYTVFKLGAVLLCDIDPGRSTTMTAIFDLDVPPREHRTMPRSIHVFER